MHQINIDNNYGYKTILKNIVYPFLLTTTIIIITFLTYSNLETYFIDALNNLGNYKSHYAIISFLILASDILLPVPSSIVMYANGYVLGITMGTSLSLVSLLVGCVVGYYLGKLTSLGTKAKSDENSNRILSKYGALAILMSRGIPILSESICIVCGYNKMPLKNYFIYNLVGYIPLCLLYAFCGSIGYDKNTFLISFGCSLLLSLAFWVYGKYFLLKSNS